MKPRFRLRRVGILGHTDRASVSRETARLKKKLEKLGCEVRLERRLAAGMDERGPTAPALGAWCQLLITLGGDGTAIAGARALAGKRGVLLPINLGGLGFLTVAEPREADEAVRAALRGEWPSSRRSMVVAKVARGDRLVRTGLAMNDAVVKGAGGYAAIHLRLSALGHDLGLLVADGLIAATAAGSTAYSLSAGGPVLSPDVEALVVTPVCAHSLGSRSLVLSPSSELAIRVIGSADRVQLLFDGQEPFGLESRDQILVRLARGAVRVLENPERPFTRALQAKLGWQGSARRSGVA